MTSGIELPRVLLTKQLSLKLIHFGSSDTYYVM